MSSGEKILMLLGDKCLLVYERDVEIIHLKNEVVSLSMELNELRNENNKLKERVRFIVDSIEDERVG